VAQGDETSPLLRLNPPILDRPVVQKRAGPFDPAQIDDNLNMIGAYFPAAS
jgi:hypothetical protein